MLIGITKAFLMTKSTAFPTLVVLLLPASRLCANFAALTFLTKRTITKLISPNRSPKSMTWKMMLGQLTLIYRESLIERLC